MAYCQVRGHAGRDRPPLQDLVEAIMRLNGIKNPRTLQIGRKIKIPGKGDPSEPEPGAGGTAAGPAVNQPA